MLFVYKQHNQSTMKFKLGNQFPCKLSQVIWSCLGDPGGCKMNWFYDVTHKERHCRMTNQKQSWIIRKTGRYVETGLLLLVRVPKFLSPSIIITTTANMPGKYRVAAEMWSKILSYNWFMPQILTNLSLGIFRNLPVKFIFKEATTQKSAEK